VVSACSRLEQLVTFSTVEAEYHALNLVVQEFKFLRQMLIELRMLHQLVKTIKHVFSLKVRLAPPARPNTWISGFTLCAMLTK
jgi:hypothetical protein